MPWKRVWEPDGEEVEAQQRGYVSKAEAARRLGRSSSFVATCIRSGSLATVSIAGRDYVTARSVDVILGQMGYPDPDNQRLEQLEESGQHHEAARLRTKMQAEATQRDMAMGITPTEVVRRVQEVPSEVDLGGFLRRFGRKGGTS